MLQKMVETFSLKWFLSLTALFIVALCISILYHLPVSWLLSQSSVQKQLPETLQLSPSHGTLWQGSTQISTLTPSLNVIGKVEWELSFWPLLFGDVNVKALWQKEQSQLRSQITLPLHSEPTELKVTGIDGNINLPQLIQILNLSDLKNMDVSGTLQVNQMDLTLDLPTQWPTILTGNLVLKQLNVLGESFPKITITPELKGNTLILKIDGKEAMWALSGQLVLSKNKQFTIQLNVTAQSANAMPSWAEMLRKQSPTVAVLNHRGVW